MKPPEIFIFLDVPKMSFCLNGTNLAVNDPFPAFYICMEFFLQFPLLPVYLHNLIFG